MKKKQTRIAELAEAMVHTGRLSLHLIRLTNSQSETHDLREKELPGVAKQGLHFEIKLSPEGDKSVVRAEFSLGVFYEEPKSDDEQPTIFVRAQYELLYSIASEAKQPDLDKIATSLQHVAAVNVWPYWREFAQSMTTRMGLPAFPIPLLQPTKHLPKATFTHEAIAHASTGESKPKSTAKR